jgi:hypothetical protein
MCGTRVRIYHLRRDDRDLSHLPYGAVGPISSTKKVATAEATMLHARDVGSKYSHIVASISNNLIEIEWTFKSCNAKLSRRGRWWLSTLHPPFLLASPYTSIRRT